MSSTAGTLGLGGPGQGQGPAPLFACSKCYSRHPFEELSAGQQLCKECRGSYPVVKCTYCRSEFQQDSKSNTSTVCKKCEQNMKTHGKPKPCSNCSIVAAFIGNRCQRCVNSERKYGPPKTCDQCMQTCAFDRRDGEDKKVDGKHLCWLCTLSYKRTLAKTKQTDPARHSHVKLSSNTKPKEPKKPNDKHPQRVDVTKIGSEDSGPSPAKHARTEHKKSTEQISNSVNVTSSSDHLVQTTMLRETIANLQREVAKRDKELLAKDRMITELKAQNFTTENECRTKVRDTQRNHEAKVDQLTSKIKQLQKEVAGLSKNVKNKSSLTIIRSAVPDRNSSGGEDSS